MGLDFEVVDVFAERPFAGNPLAVVLDADDLSTEQMQVIAREFNLSETTFPVRTSTAGADYRLRIFTPTQELPFAGHPSVGSAWLMAQLGRVPVGRIVQECGAGLLPIEVGASGAMVAGGEPFIGPPLEPEPLLTAVGLSATDLDPVAPPRAVGAGLTQVHLPLRDDAVARAKPDVALIEEAHPAQMLYVVSWSPATRTAHSRMFGPGAGVVEDPATGSAALGFGVWLGASGLVDDDATTSYVIRQGIEMGRPSLLHGSVTMSGGMVSATSVSGDVHRVSRGTLEVP
jgi:trans-2,3-dihydro-3-hydroxyanthranilate isomerase